MIRRGMIKYDKEGNGSAQCMIRSGKVGKVVRTCPETFCSGVLLVHCAFSILSAAPAPKLSARGGRGRVVGGPHLRKVAHTVTT